MHTSKMHSRRANPPLYTTGVPHTPTLPPILHPSVLAQCARFIIRNSFLLRFLLRSSHCPVDSHHDYIFSFRGRGRSFSSGDSSSGNRSGIPEASLVQGLWEKTSSSVFFCIWALEFHCLHSELMPPTANVVAAETFVVSGKTQQSS